jgi:hypothetical protein
MKRFLMFLSVLCAVALYGVAYGGPPLDISVDPTVHGMLISGACLGLTQAWKVWIAPKITTKAAPFVSLGRGVVGAIVTGFGNGMNIGQVGMGLLCGAAASGSYSVLGGINSFLQAIGVKPKPPAG